MAEQLLQGGGVFEITDHTTASDWERFVANLEEILSDWNLQKQSDDKSQYCELPTGFISRGLWHEKHDVLKFGKVSFDLRYQYLDDSQLRQRSEDKQQEDELREDLGNDGAKSEGSDQDEFQCAHEEDESKDYSIPKEVEKEYSEFELPVDLPECLRDLNTRSNDFASKAHCLVRWYNLRRFLILSPRGDTIVSEDKLKLVLSSASIALANVDCHVPIFVQLHNPKNHFYQGVSEHFNIRTMYESVFFKQNLKQYAYLSELISMFREKASCNLNDPITASIRLNYCLSTFDMFHDGEFNGTEHDDQDELIKMTSKKSITHESRPPTQDMRSGATFDQVVEAMDTCVPHPYKILRFLHVAALWPPLSDKVITDSQVHSDIDPVEAPIWTIRCVTSDNCNMKLVHETQVVYDLLESAIDYAYDKLDAGTVFTDCDRDGLKAQCLKISYELAIQPEVTLSENPSDSIRKIIALLFYRAKELYGDSDAFDQIVKQVKKKTSLSVIYRDFKKQKASVKEFIIRTQVSRPFNPISTPALPQRMFCTISDEEFRLCGAFSELCN